MCKLIVKGIVVSNSYNFWLAVWAGRLRIMSSTGYGSGFHAGIVTVGHGVTDLLWVFHCILLTILIICLLIWKFAEGLDPLVENQCHRTKKKILCILLYCILPLYSLKYHGKYQCTMVLWSATISLLWYHHTRFVLGILTYKVYGIFFSFRWPIRTLAEGIMVLLSVEQLTWLTPTGWYHIVSLSWTGSAKYRKGRLKRNPRAMKVCRSACYHVTFSLFLLLEM